MIQPELQDQLKDILQLHDGMALSVDRLADWDIHRLSRRKLRGEEGIMAMVTVVERLAQKILAALDKAIAEDTNKKYFWETTEQTDQRLQHYHDVREELVAQVNGAFEAADFTNRIDQSPAAERSPTRAR